MSTKVDLSTLSLVTQTDIHTFKSTVENSLNIFTKKYDITKIDSGINFYVNLSKKYNPTLNSLSAKTAKKLDSKNYKYFIESISRNKNYSSILDNLHILEIDYDIELKIKDLVRSIENENIDFEKFFYSFVNFSSKLREISSVKCKKMFFFNRSTNLIQAEMTRSTTSNFFVNLSLQFSDSGNVNYFVRDDDDENISYITGTVTKYRKYSSSYRFNSIIDLIFTGE